jgi:hypothetical protein
VVAAVDRIKGTGSEHSEWRISLTDDDFPLPGTVGDQFLHLARFPENIGSQQALELEPHEVAAALGGLPEDHLHCARLAINTLGEAIADYYGKAASSASGSAARPNL